MKYVLKILATTRHLWKYYLAIGMFTIGLSLLTLSQPILSGWIVDELGKGTDTSLRYVVRIAILIFVLDVAYTVFSNISGYFGDLMAVRLQKSLSERYYEHLLTLPQRYFDTELSGKIINRLSRSVSQITNFMQMMSNSFLQFIFGTIFALIAVAWYSWQVALMLLMLYPIYIWMTFRSSSTWQRYQKKKNKHIDIASGRFAEAITQLKVVKSFVSERHELKYFRRHMDVMVDTNTPQSKYWHKRDVERRLVLNIIFFVVYIYVFVAATRGTYTPGQAVALILLAMNIRIPIFTISFLVDSTQRAIADSKDYFEVMGEKPVIADKIGAAELSVKAGHIVFDDVSFSYDHKQPVLKRVALSIEPGSKTALVGESGEGKTTLTNLLLRLYEPEKGSIAIDGQNIAEVTQLSLRRNIAVVFQDPSLFSGTIRENIGYALPGASLSQIEKAAKAANAHDFIEKLDKGYDTQIGERGLKLSGGQKQRIAIARALLKNAPILVLDEATSSLDSRSEHMVQQALERLMKGRTTLIIAHRLSTIQHVDQIVTLSGGTIDEVGTPAALAKTQGIYAQLLELQREKPSETKRKKLRAYDIAD
jgi:ATP-binding cassette subfamily B protein